MTQIHLYLFTIHNQSLECKFNSICCIFLYEIYYRPPMHTYNLPTTSSLGRMVTKTPSPSKITTPWLPPSPSPNLPPVLSPAKAALKPSRSLSKLPVPVQTTPRQLQGSPLKVFSVTPGSNKKARYLPYSECEVPPTHFLLQSCL